LVAAPIVASCGVVAECGRHALAHAVVEKLATLIGRLSAGSTHSSSLLFDICFHLHDDSGRWALRVCCYSRGDGSGCRRSATYTVMRVVRIQKRRGSALCAGCTMVDTGQITAGASILASGCHSANGAGCSECLRWLAFQVCASHLNPTHCIGHKDVLAACVFWMCVVYAPPFDVVTQEMAGYHTATQLCV
jgi:hypothetical protein